MTAFLVLGRDVLYSFRLAQALFNGCCCSDVNVCK